MGKNKKGKSGANKAEKNAGGEDSEPLVSKEEDNDSQTDVTSPDEVSTVEVQPAVAAETDVSTVTEPTQEESAAVKEEEVVVETTSVAAEDTPVAETVAVAESSEAEAPAPAPEVAVEQNKETEEPKEEPKAEPKKEPKEDHHERTYAEVVASNIPEERDSVNEDHPLMGDSKTVTTPATAQPTPEFDETSELTVEPAAAPAEATSTPVVVAKEAPNESPKEESSFFTCLSSFKFW